MTLTSKASAGGTMALAVLMAGGALGAIFLPPAAQFFIEKLGWRGAFLVLGAMSLGVGLPVVARFVRERPGLRGTGRTEVRDASFQEGLRSRAFWVIVTVLFLSSISQNGAMICSACPVNCLSFFFHCSAIWRSSGRNPGSPS